MIEFLVGAVLGIVGGWFLKGYYEEMMQGLK
jgi:hypothetical protein